MTVSIEVQTMKTRVQNIIRRRAVVGAMIVLTMPPIWQIRAGHETQRAPSDNTRIDLRYVSTKLAPNVAIRRMDIPRQDGSFITVYLCSDRRDILRAKPLLVLLHGSGGSSVFAALGQKLAIPFPCSELCHHEKNLTDGWNVVLIEKRGIQLGDHGEPFGSGYRGCSPEYISHATIQGRIEDASRVIDQLIGQGLYDKSRLVVIGHSDGAGVAAGVAAANPNITHVALLGTSGAPTPFNLLTELRGRLETGQISPQEFTRQYDSIVTQFRDIHANPLAIDKHYRGHAYRYHASHFTSRTRDLFAAGIPVFIGIGSRDFNAVGADLLVVQAIQQSKANLTYRHYVGCDHGFYTRRTDGTRGPRANVLDDIIQWVEQTNSQ